MITIIEKYLDDAEYKEYFSHRIARLRELNGATAQSMSLAIGQSRGYVNKIENKQILPSLIGLLKICEFLNITPQDFFDDGVECPEQLNKLIIVSKTLNQQELERIIGVAEEIVKYKTEPPKA